MFLSIKLSHLCGKRWTLVRVLNLFWKSFSSHEAIAHIQLTWYIHPGRILLHLHFKNAVCIVQNIILCLNKFLSFIWSIGFKTWSLTVGNCETSPDPKVYRSTLTFTHDNWLHEIWVDSLLTFCCLPLLMHWHLNSISLLILGLIVRWVVQSRVQRYIIN